MFRGELFVAAVFLFTALSIACGPTTSKDAHVQNRLAESFEVESGPGRIAYVGLDGHVRTSNPDGSAKLRISPRTGRYFWPTWSPDSQNLVFSGLIEGQDSRRNAALFNRDLSTGELSRVHVGNAGDAFVANGAPHYVYWSPDSKHIAFLAGTPSGLRLYVDDLEDNDPPDIAMDGVPVFMDWSPNSKRIFIHFESEHFLFETDQNQLSRLGIKSKAVGYKVPTWQPNTDLLTYAVVDNSGGISIYSSIDGYNPKLIVDDVPENVTFRWSPNGQWLAVTSPEQVFSYPPLGLLIYSQISLYSENGEIQSVQINDDVVAFYWSPDSTKIAYVTLVNQDQQILRWKVLNVLNGGTSTLIDFIPSFDQLTMLQFFDQFTGSHQLWSPDSRSLVFAGKIGGGAILAATNQEKVDRIVIVAAGAFASTDVISNGTLAVWSPG